MENEVHIASFVVSHRPEAAGAIERLAAASPELEIAAREAARCIVLHESSGTRDLLASMDAIQALPGVINVSLVYHHAEPRAALAQVLTPEDAR